MRLKLVSEREYINIGQFLLGTVLFLLYFFNYPIKININILNVILYTIVILPIGVVGVIGIKYKGIGSLDINDNEIVVKTDKSVEIRMQINKVQKMKLLQEKVETTVFGETLFVYTKHRV